MSVLNGSYLISDTPLSPNKRALCLYNGVLYAATYVDAGGGGTDYIRLYSSLSGTTWSTLANIPVTGNAFHDVTMVSGENGYLHILNKMYTTTSHGFIDYHRYDIAGDSYISKLNFVDVENYLGSIGLFYDTATGYCHCALSCGKSGGTWPEGTAIHGVLTDISGSWDVSDVIYASGGRSWDTCEIVKTSDRLVFYGNRYSSGNYSLCYQKLDSGGGWSNVWATASYRAFNMCVDGDTVYCDMTALDGSNDIYTKTLSGGVWSDYVKTIDVSDLGLGATYGHSRCTSADGTQYIVVTYWTGTNYGHGYFKYEGGVWSFVPLTLIGGGLQDATPLSLPESAQGFACLYRDAVPGSEGFKVYYYNFVMEVVSETYLFSADSAELSYVLSGASAHQAIMVTGDVS